MSKEIKVKKSSAPKKTEAKPESKAEAKPEVKSEAKSEAKPKIVKKTSKPVTEEKKAPSIVVTEKPVEVAVEASVPMICVIRIRGAHGMRRIITDTLSMMNLHSVNHATIIPLTPSNAGMIQKAKDYIAYGPINADTLGKLLKKRGLLVGNKPLTDNHVKFSTNYDSINGLAKGIVENKIKIRDVKDLKPVFRLHPPHGGFKGSIKKPFKAGGELGNQGPKINDLVQRMI
jgi:large subunit ribosomal protein L30